MRLKRLTTDPERMEGRELGVYIWAQNTEGKWARFDITRLDRGSLVSWLQFIGEDGMIRLILYLLGHQLMDEQP